MTPVQRYEQDISRKLVSPDIGQIRAIEALQVLFLELSPADESERKKINPFRKWWVEEKLTQGIYLWGGVGRGKTYLMDLFFDCVQIPQKQRTHFHRFMFSIHTELKALQGKKNPLSLIAKKIANQTRLLCVDEFFVLDIGDAMLLSRLLEALFERGVVLVATSNLHPDELYKDGLQRDNFLPAIEMIKKYTTIIELESGLDYRLRTLSTSTLYHSPDNEETEKKLFTSFLDLVPNPSDIQKGRNINILGREIVTRYLTEDVIWFDFAVLCSAPRGALDYIEIARTYHAVLLSGVPQLNDGSEDKVRRFVNLIDEFYDRKVKLIISAHVDIANMYSDTKLKFEFRRTSSRLAEMQSHRYLASPHIVC